MTGFSAPTRIHATLLAFGHPCPCSCTIATEIGDTARFATLTKLAGYTGLCPVYLSGDKVDSRCTGA